MPEQGPVIYLELRLPATTIGLPLATFVAKKQDEQPCPPKRLAIYVAFQPDRGTTATVARGIGGLLHRLLTLTACAAVIFFYPSAPSRTPFFRKVGALRCPDFPHCLRSATGRPAIGCKCSEYLMLYIRLRTSDIRLQTSDYGLQTTDFRLRTSDFRQRTTELVNR